jgi:hypothetical protein
MSQEGSLALLTLAVTAAAVVALSGIARTRLAADIFNLESAAIAAGRRRATPPRRMRLPRKLRRPKRRLYVVSTARRQWAGLG